MALFATGALDEAARVLEEAMARSPDATELAPPLAATYAHLGRRREARELLLRWRPGASQAELSQHSVRLSVGPPMVARRPRKWPIGWSTD